MRKIQISLYDWCIKNNRQDLLDEWDKEKNESNGIFYDKIGPQSNQYAYWKCKYEHSWKAKISNRFNGRGCPECSKRLRTSFPEQAIYYYIKKCFPDAINSYKNIFDNGMELDIYIPSMKIGIEYDGIAWHKTSQLKKEEEKYHICKENGISLCRIKENYEHFKSNYKTADKTIFIRKPFNNSEKAFNSLNYVIKELLYYFGEYNVIPFSYINNIVNESNAYQLVAISIPVDARKDKHLILENYLEVLKENSLESKYPEIAKHWHPTKNGNLYPSMFSPHSSVKVWWLGECGHEWYSSITTATRGYGCPYCSGNRVLKGFNDLATVKPEKAKLWHPTKNGNKTPDMFTYGSGYKAYWLCPTCEQTWQAAINSSHGCPYCAHEKPIKGINDFATLRPDLLKEWDFNKNINIDPYELMPNSNKKVWWKCSKCGFEFIAAINHRNKRAGCRKCSGQILISGINDLETLYPDIAKEWDYKSNIAKPNEVFPKTNKKYGWICSLGHKWNAAPSTRCSGSGCPICSGNKVLVGFNDLVTTHPEIALEWHPTKNGALKPTDVSKGYKFKVWFMCPKCNNDYESYIYNKIKGYGKCPYCSSKKKKTING